MTVSQQIRCYKEIGNVSEANIIGLCSLIQNETFTDVFHENDMKKKWDSCSSSFNCYFNLACPKVRKNIVNLLNVPWINNDIITPTTKLRNVYDLYIHSTIEISIKHIKRDTML
jgi:hypothetical protein